MDNGKEYLRWSDIVGLIKMLAIEIKKNKYTSIFGIPRGGIHVAQELARELNLPIVLEPVSPDTLIVDDIIDSGKTLSKYKGYDTAVLHCRNNAKETGVEPTYFASISDRWIVYPWEIQNGEDEGIQANIVRMLEYAGEDPNREGLLETPKRFEKAWEFWTKGYKEKPEDVMKFFESPGVDQLIVVPHIDFYSMCEHHLAPFFGQIHIGYVPNKKVLGVSKFARLANIYARRLQIQERFSQQVADDIMKYLEPQGVGVVVRATHLCMRSRGVEKENAEMVTSVMLGYFRDKAELRAEFMGLIG